jgi:hypothetical protein
MFSQLCGALVGNLPDYVITLRCIPLRFRAIGCLDE